jgi:molybdopterin-guanine dinucleotide biosynthesis protein B
MKVIGISGYSGSGKTTLIERVIPELVVEGFKVSLIKHAHHEFDIDQPGKDSWRHRQAGATEVLITSNRRWALMHEMRNEEEPSLAQQLEHLAPCDVVIIEGYKNEIVPKIEVHRAASNKPLLFSGDANIVALATDELLATSLPQFGIDDAEGIAQFIIRHLALRKPPIRLIK